MAVGDTASAIDMLELVSIDGISQDIGVVVELYISAQSGSPATLTRSLLSGLSERA